ncbi:hypothetical protein H5410_035047 [Solanum commersonii]|uniref:Uncharacterized protein n=1 Tax=Solanum commersonii TaxID=4109 RepID=A0A9J5Y1T4_SOLCO|nr:hypothetical protein H5410_035047 [Solanum commersonii]
MQKIATLSSLSDDTFEMNTSAWEANHLLKLSSRFIVFSVGNPIPRRQSIITREATQCASAAATTNTWKI